MKRKISRCPSCLQENNKFKIYRKDRWSEEWGEGITLEFCPTPSCLLYINVTENIYTNVFGDQKYYKLLETWTGNSLF